MSLFDRVRAVVLEPISPAPLSALRITFSLLMLAEIAHLIHRRHLFFLPDPLQPFPADLGLLLGLWVVALVCLLVGFLTPLAALVNYRFVAYYLSSSPFIYHADVLYIPTALFMVILPVYRRWSVDAALVRRWRGVDLSTRPVPRLVVPQGSWTRS